MVFYEFLIVIDSLVAENPNFKLNTCSENSPDSTLCFGANSGFPARETTDATVTPQNSFAWEQAGNSEATPLAPGYGTNLLKSHWISATAPRPKLPQCCCALVDLQPVSTHPTGGNQPGYDMPLRAEVKAPKGPASHVALREAMATDVASH